MSAAVPSTQFEALQIRLAALMPQYVTENDRPQGGSRKLAGETNGMCRPRIRVDMGNPFPTLGRRENIHPYRVPIRSERLEFEIGPGALRWRLDRP